MRTRVYVNKWSLALISFILCQVGYAQTNFWQLNMRKGVTPVSNEMYNLHMICMAVCLVIGVIVFSVMIYSLIYHRKSRGYSAASFHEHPKLEMIWSLIPFLILVGLAVPATKSLIRLNDTRDSEVTIKVVGSQWKWQYQYLDQGISYYSNIATPYNQIYGHAKKNQWYLLEVDKPLVLPVGKKIRFLVTSNDVVHSWWVPALGIKRDAIPGFMYESWAVIEKPGTYRGQCAELCGINHGYMPIVVKAVEIDAFNQWVSEQPKVNDIYAAPTKAEEAKVFTLKELMTAGKTKYDQYCAACHRADGKGIPPLYPALQGSSVAVGKPIDRHIHRMLFGVPGSAMQAYKDVLSNEEMAAIVTYERNAWGNNTNDLVQPADIEKVRVENTQQPTMVKKAQTGGLKDER